jgi:hypothetical protein
MISRDLLSFVLLCGANHGQGILMTSTTASAGKDALDSATA